MSEDANVPRGRRRSSSISISDLPDSGSAARHARLSSRKRSSSLDGPSTGTRGHGINRSLEKDMKVLLDAVDSWNTDINLPQDEQEDTDSASVEDSVKEWIKLILLGNSGVGKTSIMVRFDTKKFPENTISTTGVDFRTKKFSVNRRRVNCQLWDTAGQERFSGITRAYYRDADGILIVYDVTDEQSLKDLDRWIEDLQTNASEACRKILLCNKVDLPHDPAQIEKGKALAAANGYKFCRTSAMSGQNVFKAVKLISREIIEDRIGAGTSASSSKQHLLNDSQQPRARRCSCR